MAQGRPDENMTKTETRLKLIQLAAMLLALRAVWAPTVVLGQFDEYAVEETPAESPEWGMFELKVGVYQPDGTDAFKNSFGDERGPWVGGEIDVTPLRIPYLGLFGGGVAVGWASYTGKTVNAISGELTDEPSTLSVFPLSPMLVLRIDVLARELRTPLIFTGKAGMDVVPWRSEKGGQSDGSGVSFGFRWALQMALELDFLEPRSARSLDNTWGINHSYLFFELFGSTADTSIALQDSLAFAGGLGLAF